MERYPQKLNRFRELVVLVLCVMLFLMRLACVKNVSKIMVTEKLLRSVVKLQ